MAQNRQVPIVSFGAGGAVMALPLLHGAGGPLDELISLGVLVVLMVVASVVFILSGRKKK